MNAWRKFESIVKPIYIVAAFVLLLLWGLSREADASETHVELGATFLSGEPSKGAMLLLNEVWNDKWVVGMGIASPQTVTDRSGTTYDVRTNLMVHGQRLVYITPKFRLGLGVAYWNAKTRWNGSNFTASMSVEYDLPGKWYATYRHWSNAGSASPNMGQDVFNIGYNF